MEFIVKMKKAQAALLENCVCDNLYMYKGEIFYIMKNRCYAAFNKVKKERGDLSETWISVGNNIINKCIRQIESLVSLCSLPDMESYKKVIREISDILDIISDSERGITDDDIVEMKFDESQIGILNNICDTYSRFICGQTFSIVDWMMNIWAASHYYKMGDYCDVKMNMEIYVSILHNLCWNDSDNAYNGIGYDEDSDCLYDMHQVFRYELWKLLDPDKRSQYTVDAFPAMKVSGKYDLIDVKLV